MQQARVLVSQHFSLSFLNQESGASGQGAPLSLLSGSHPEARKTGGIPEEKEQKRGGEGLFPETGPGASRRRGASDGRRVGACAPAGIPAEEGFPGGRSAVLPDRGLPRRRSRRQDSIPGLVYCNGVRLSSWRTWARGGRTLWGGGMAADSSLMFIEKR